MRRKKVPMPSNPTQENGSSSEPIGPQIGPSLGPLARGPKKQWYERIDLQVLGRNGVYGGIMGCVMGFGFGIQSGMTAAQLKNMGATFDALKSGGKQRATLLRVARGTSFAFGGFFSLFQMGFYGTTKYRNTGIDLEQFAACGAVAILPFLRVQYLRKNLPYAAALIALDAFSWYSNEQRMKGD